MTGECGHAMADTMEPSSTPPVDTSEITYPSRRPQLRLHHFFVLTAVAAAVLAINGPQKDYWGNVDFKRPRSL